jgi:hypothetical protein
MNTETPTETTESTAAIPGSPLATLLGMFFEPGKSFAAIEKKSMVLLPLLLTMVGGVALIFWYYQQVDFAWLQDKILAGKDMEPAQRDAALKFMTKSMMTNMSLLGVLIGPPIMYAITALYYLIVAKITDIPVSYGKWFAFVTWSSVPNLLAFLLGVVQILLASQGHLAYNQLNPLSLDQLFFHVEMSSPWATLLDSISATSIWSLVLMVVGFQAWSKKPRLTSIAIVLAPSIVILGGMALLALHQTAS